MRAFADALDSVPMALAENSGLSPIETLASIKSRQVKEKNSRLGVDCMQTGSNGKPSSHSSAIMNLSIRIYRVFRVDLCWLFAHPPRYPSQQRCHGNDYDWSISGETRRPLSFSQYGFQSVLVAAHQTMLQHCPWDGMLEI
jgi:hypothetical protein